MRVYLSDYMTTDEHLLPRKLNLDKPTSWLCRKERPGKHAALVSVDERQSCVEIAFDQQALTYCDKVSTGKSLLTFTQTEHGSRGEGGTSEVSVHTLVERSRG